MIDAAARINYFKQKEEQMLRDFQQDEQNIKEMWTTGAKRKRIEEWLNDCKERVKLGDPEIPTQQQIGRYMRNKVLQKKILSSLPYLYEIVPKDCKDDRDSIKRWAELLLASGSVSASDINAFAVGDQTAKSFMQGQNEAGEEQHQEQGEGNGNNEDDNRDENNDGQNSLPFGKPLTDLQHDEAIIAASIFDKQMRDSVAWQKKIRDSQEIIAGLAERNKWKDVKIKVKATTADRPDPRESSLSERVRRHGEKWLKLAEKIAVFPPSPDDEIAFVKAMDPYDEFVDFLIDDKTNQSALAWLATIKTMEASHKHAAAVLHGTNARIKEFYEDEETGETKFRWIEVPRSFTREQVGDQREGMLDLAIEIIKNQPIYHALAQWKDKYVKPYLFGRKVKLHEEFSDKAFSGGGNLS